MTDSFRIDVFSDPVCPWCLLGLTRLDVALAKLGGASQALIAHHPFLLDASVPAEGQNVVEMLKQKYGRDPSEMWDRLEAEAKKSGLDLDMRKQKWRHPSQKALALIQAAAGKGTQHKVAVALSHACYLDAQDISDVAVLTEIGLANGFSVEEVQAFLSSDNLIEQVEKAASDAAQSGVTGVPFFIFNNQFALSGAQPQEVFDQAVGMAARGEAPQAAE